MRNIAGEIERIAGGKFVCYTVNNEPHLAFANVTDLLLWMGVRRHDTPGRQRGEHLIHRFAVCDRPARDAGTNFNCRALLFHLRTLRRAPMTSSDFLYPKLLVSCHLSQVT